MNILITGHSNGLGKALCFHYLSQKHHVTGLSRSSIKKTSNADEITFLSQHEETFLEFQVDFSKLPLELSKGENTWQNSNYDLVVVCHGFLEEATSLDHFSYEHFHQIMNINALSTLELVKVINSSSLNNKTLNSPTQFLIISSGASQKNYQGWPYYCLSKQLLNSLVEMISRDFSIHHFILLAPGLVDTDMQKKIREYDESIFPSKQKFVDAYEKKTLESPKSAAIKIAAFINDMHTLKSGSYHDLRTL